MLRRWILELSNRRSLRQVPSLSQSSYLLPRKQFSSSSRQNVSGKSPSNYNPSTAYQKPPVSTEPVPGGGGGNMVKLVVGGVLISGVVAATAYQLISLKDQKTLKESNELNLKDDVIVNDQKPSVSKDDTSNVEKDAGGSHVSRQSEVQDGLNVTSRDQAVSSQQNELSGFAQSGPGTFSDDQATNSSMLSEETSDKEEVEDGASSAQSNMDQNEIAKETSSVQDWKHPSSHNLTTQESPQEICQNG